MTLEEYVEQFNTNSPIKDANRLGQNAVLDATLNRTTPVVSIRNTPLEMKQQIDLAKTAPTDLLKREPMKQPRPAGLGMFGMFGNSGKTLPQGPKADQADQKDIKPEDPTPRGPSSSR